jgi:RNA polymerase sigma-70 factor, ECF subfamily
MQPSSATDETLIEKIGQGSHEAFSVLVTRHTKRFYTLAYRTLIHKDAAEDIVQDMFLKLWQKPHLFNPSKHAAFTTWFYRVVINACLDHNKKKILKSVEEHYAILTDPTPEAGVTLDHSRQKLLLEKKILELPERQQIALNLCFFEELSNQEAADIMNINLKALQSLVMRAKSNLKKSLSPLFCEDNAYEHLPLHGTQATHFSQP